MFDPDPFAMPKRKQLRLAGYDYSTPGNYVVAIATHARRPIFGKVENYSVARTALGEMVNTEILNLPNRLPTALVDVHIVMPDHVHIIFELRGGITLGTAVGAFKSRTSYYAAKNFSIERLWQRNYHEHIIRNEYSLVRQRKYVESNPVIFSVRAFEAEQWHNVMRELSR
jgi:putative transposase